MADFPTLSKGVSINFERGINKPMVKTSFDGNYSQTRPKYTRTVNTFTVNFAMIDDTDITAIETFFNTNQGGDFNFTNPSTSTVHLVRFASDDIVFKHVANGKYTTKIVLEEV